jgi:hypothetical protein
MPQNWLKMRLRLPEDPKVISMADYIAMQRAFMDWLTDPVHEGCKETAYEHVTRNVTVALCVTGLLRTWGVAYERGRQEGTNLVLDFCNIEQVDQIAGFPCFGEALEHVGWAKEGDDGNCLIFINYMVDNTCDGERIKEANRQRQRRYRARLANSFEHGDDKSNVTHNVTVTSCNAVEQEQEQEKNAIAIAPEELSFLQGAIAEESQRSRLKSALMRLHANEALANEVISLQPLPSKDVLLRALGEQAAANARGGSKNRSKVFRRILHDHDPRVPCKTEDSQ